MNEVQKQILEMAQIKTRFDTEKFTVGKEGDFIASQFHFLMRQYRFALQEKQRMQLDIEEAKRERALLQKEQMRRETGEDYETSSEHTEKRLATIEHVDIEIARQDSKIFGLEVDHRAKVLMIGDFEEMRNELIKQNGGEAPTNKQFQEEQPAYYRWYIGKMLWSQAVERATGIKEGALNAALMAARKPVLPSSNMQIPSFVVKGGQIDFVGIGKAALLECDRLIGVREGGNGKELDNAQDTLPVK